jgi:hypothetical protein
MRHAACLVSLEYYCFYVILIVMQGPKFTISVEWSRPEYDNEILKKPLLQRCGKIEEKMI